LLHRWVEDSRILHGNQPLVLLVADHGFTYGPGNDSSEGGGTHRCLPVEVKPEANNPKSESMTFLDRSMFHNRRHYMAVRQRRMSQGTVSGWRMSHGGLLPEEVIVPVVEWFGSEEAIAWPAIEVVGEAYRELGAWRFNVKLANPSVRAIPSGSAVFRTSGQTQPTKREFPKITPGHPVALQISMATESAGESAELHVDVVIELIQSDGTVSSFEQSLKVKKSRQLAERTEEQDSFENMF